MEESLKKYYNNNKLNFIDFSRTTLLFFLIRLLNTNKYSIEEIRKFKFADCYGGQETLLYYLKKNFGIKRLYDIDERPLQATHVALTNRSFANIRNNPYTKSLVDDKGIFLLSDLETVLRSRNVKTTCFKFYSGTDEVTVSRNGVPLSTIRKLDK